MTDSLAAPDDTGAPGRLFCWFSCRCFHCCRCINRSSFNCNDFRFCNRWWSIENDHGNSESDQAEQFGSRKADEQTSLLAVGRRWVAQSAFKEGTENITNTGSSGTNADCSQASADNLCRREIHFLTPYCKIRD